MQLLIKIINNDINYVTIRDNKSNIKNDFENFSVIEN